MKIVHIAHTYIDNYSYQENELPEAQAKLGNDVTIISTRNYAGCFNYNVPDLSALESYTYTIGRCRIIRLPLRYKANYRFIMYRGLYKTLVAERPDLIYFHELPYFCLWDIVKYIRKNRKCKLFIDYHCDIHNSGNNLASRLFLHKCFYRFLTKITDKYVGIRYAVTPGTGKFMKEMYGIPDSRIKLLPLGGDLEKMNVARAGSIRKEIRTGLKMDEKDLMIVSAGKINRSKNLHLLIEAYQKADKPAHSKLLLIGSIEDPQYREELSQLAGNDPGIIFTGWKSPDEIYNFFMASDFACFPGSQSVLWQQAICCGLPLICKYWDGAEYLNVANNILFTKEDSADDLQRCIQQMISKPEMLDTMRHNARTKGKAYFSYERIAQSVIEDYNSL